MSGRTDPPDWLDELYQQDRNELPPPALDDQIRSAARKALIPWYRQPARLATAATLLLAAGVATIWLGNPQLQQAAGPEITVISNPVSVVDEITVTPRQPSVAPAPEPAAVLNDADREASAPRSQAGYASQRADLSQLESRSEEAVATARKALPASAAEPVSCRQLPLTTAEGAARFQLCESADESSIRHPDCDEPYPLTSADTVIAVTAEMLQLRTQQGTAQLRCTQGQWQLSETTPSQQQPDPEHD